MPRQHLAPQRIPADSRLRPTGIPIVGEISWGTHICVFYQNKNDLLDIAASYFAAGLDSNEVCVWAAPPPIRAEDTTDLLRGRLPNIDERVAAGQIQILPGYACLSDKGFDPQRIIMCWKEKLNYALTHGYSGMRGMGNAFWCETNLWKEFIEYEQDLRRALADQKMIGMYTYSLTDSRADDVLDVARAHDFTIARRNSKWEVLETPEFKQAKLERKRLIEMVSPPFLI